jgi:hypothetical protein
MTVKQQCEEICRVLKSKPAILSDATLDEHGLRRALNLRQDLNWQAAGRPRLRNLFGWPEDRSDYQSKVEPPMIIEFKILNAKREYDFKNALAQLLVQAIASPAERGILLVIDRGRGCSRDWNTDEQRFLEAFWRNCIGIELGVVRVRLVGQNR